MLRVWLVVVLNTFLEGVVMAKSIDELRQQVEHEEREVSYASLQSRSAQKNVCDAQRKARISESLRQGAVGRLHVAREALAAVTGEKVVYVLH